MLKKLTIKMTNNLNNMQIMAIQLLQQDCQNLLKLKLDQMIRPKRKNKIF